MEMPHNDKLYYWSYEMDSSALNWTQMERDNEWAPNQDIRRLSPNNFGITAWFHMEPQIYLSTQRLLTE